MKMNYFLVGKSIVAYDEPLQDTRHQRGSVVVAPISSKLKNTVLDVYSVPHEIISDMGSGQGDKLLRASNALYPDITHKLDEGAFRMIYVLGNINQEGSERVHSIPVSVIAARGYPLNGHSGLYMAVFTDEKPRLAISGEDRQVMDNPGELKTLQERLTHAFSDKLARIDIPLMVNEDGGNIYNFNMVKPARGIGLREFQSIEQHIHRKSF